VISSEGRLNPKFSGGIVQQRRILPAEGRKVLGVAGKKAPAVAGFERTLVRF